MSASRTRRKPLGVAWRMKAGGIGAQPIVEVHSRDYLPALGALPDDQRLPKRTTFDELVVLAGDGAMVIHVEQMDERTYFVQLGGEKRMVWVDRKGKVCVGEKYE